MKTRMLLSELLEQNGIDPENVVLIRHPMSNEGFSNCYKAGFFKLYTQIQNKSFAMLNEKKIWMVFIGREGTTAEFYKLYKQKGFSDIRDNKVPDGFPYPNDFEQSYLYLYDLEEMDTFKDTDLIIDWGSSARRWYQKATNPKPVLEKE